jgi:WD40 repeat protein
MYHKRRTRESDPDDDDDDYNNKRKLRRRMMDAGIDSEIGWIAHEEESNNEHHIFPRLKFSPDGIFLIFASDDGIVRLWKYNIASYWESQT